MKGSITSRLLYSAVAGINAIAAVGTLWSAYGGMLNPGAHPLSGLMCLSFPIWLIADLALIVADAFILKRLIAIPVIAMLISAGPISDFCPLNIHIGSTDNDDSFTLLTYNVTSFADSQGKTCDKGNRTLQQIIDMDATMVCLQEVFSDKMKKSKCGITEAQIDSIEHRYKHRYKSQDGLVFLSKYPFEAHSYPREKGDAAEMCRIDTDIDGHRLIIFNVHLQSLGFKREEKRLFRKLTDMHPHERELKGVRSKLLAKFKAANIVRLSQVGRIVEHIRQAKEEHPDCNIIVCGDFNDVQSSYCLRRLAKAGLLNAYSQAGFGPTITHHADHFFFRIDHLLYEGDLEAADIERGDIPSSDHYPLMATFQWKESPSDTASSNP